MPNPIRVGIVGAGANTRLRHIPGFRAIAGVELAGVVNQSAASTQRAVEQHGITKGYESWQALVDDATIDAIMIGTWPNMHAEITCAALESGKHVLTEARMARNAVEARQMHAAAKRSPQQIAQIVPSPFGLREHGFVRSLINDGYLGELRELVVIGANDQFYDSATPLHWRQDKEISGSNLLAMGILHEAAMRWTPPTTRAFAQTNIFQSIVGPESGQQHVTVPDSAHIVTQLAGGASGVYHLSGCTLFGPGLQIHLYGSRGTIKLQLAPSPGLWIGQAGDQQLQLADIPPEVAGGWRVEEEFIDAIRGVAPVQFTTFDDGLAYMEFTDAVTQSSDTGAVVEIGGATRS
jgi:predicted dehydrogenase